MRITFIQTVFITLCVCVSYADEVRAQKILDRRVTLSVKNLKVETLLEQISDQTNARFVYSPEVIPANFPITLNIKDQRLEHVLESTLIPLKIQYIVSNKRTILLRNISSELLVKTNFISDERNISGKVTDENGIGLVGVSILVKGAQHRTTTDAEGVFVITLSNDLNSLIFSYVGYESQEIAVGNKTFIEISLKEDMKALEEVVVVGYGTQTRKELTSAVSSIGRSKLKDFSVSSFSEALVGQVAGVQISQVNGEPGASLNIRIRGTGSITAGNNPLYVVDGFPLHVEALSTINTSDIESIEILKDASATAIYGSRGSNGVVIITTRRGAVGTPKIEFNSYTGMQSLSKKVDVLNPDEYVELAIEAIQNAWVDRGGSSNDPNSARPALYQIAPYFLTPEEWVRTDWQDEIYRTASISDFNLNASGGTEKMKYMVSAGYFDQKGILLNTGFKRYSGRFNLNGTLTDRIKFQVNFSPNYSVNENVKGAGRWNEGAIGSALALPGIFPVRNIDGTYPSFHNFGYNSSAAFNPVSLVEQANGTDNRQRMTANTKISVDISKDLTYDLNTGVDHNTFEDSFYISTIMPSGTPPGGQFSTYSNSNWVIENTINYTKELSTDHRFNLLIGQSAQHSKTTESYMMANNYPNDLVKTLNAGQIVSGNTTESEWALASYFSRLTYAFKEKYFLNAAIRRDGSSRFGENKKWGLFPSISVGWRIAEENFLKNSSLIDELKLRTSYGVTGNNFISNYGSIGLLKSVNYVFDNSIVNGQVPSTFSNALLSWETSKQFDFGVDLAIFNGRVNLVYDFYNKVNSNLLLNVPVPSITGMNTSLRNIGSVRNRGMEWMLTTQNLINKFSWTTSFNISYNRNNVLALGPEGDPIITNGMATMEGTHITQVGQPIGSFYGFIFDGIYNTQDEIASMPHLESDRPGDPIIRDVNMDGIINMDDRTIIGNNYPDYTFGFDNTFRYKNFDLRVFFHGVQGLEILNLTKHGIGIMHGRLNQLGEARNRWRSPEEPGNGKVFRADLDINGYRRLASTHYMEDASFVNLRNITLGYSFNKNILNKLRISNAKVFITGQNLLTLTDYSMYNPEASQSSYNSPLSPGSDMDVYPLAKTYTVGLNITF